MQCDRIVSEPIDVKRFQGNSITPRPSRLRGEVTTHLEARAEGKVFAKPKVIENTPVANTLASMTGFRPNRSAIIPQAKLEMRLPVVELPVTKLE